MAKQRKSEVTSARVARIAAWYLRIEEPPKGVLPRWLKWSDIRALAASALTQAEDRLIRSGTKAATAAEPLPSKRVITGKNSPKPRRRARRK